jgi:hypothetical protein
MAFVQRKYFTVFFLIFYPEFSNAIRIIIQPVVFFGKMSGAFIAYNKHFQRNPFLMHKTDVFMLEGGS